MNMLLLQKVEVGVTKGVQPATVYPEHVESYFRRDCLNLKWGKGEISGQKNDDNRAIMVQDNDSAILFINEEKECMHMTGVESKWVVDTTTSYHATLICSR
ncbi:hypothetical protein KY290_000522 [Solanum tuberosum]|uniref:Uncharacterized protein n=1 Tax=Solanum tuberosum TaxID=4113 RepID=A0ABQ7WJK5_SOLTU|nr:hypothetical protein KY289_000571 [Solanum tuberosum]KAH0780924.1 hypothetical protein KY290_000522 [Solanum tuberosum]